MIVGKTGSGKSVSWQMLQLVLSTMKKDGVQGYNLVKVLYDPLTDLTSQEIQGFNSFENSATMHWS